MNKSRYCIEKGVVLMKKKYSIGIFTLIALIILSFAYQAEYRYDQKMEQEARALEQEQMEKAVSTQGNAKKEEIYYLAELNGYVVVYQSDKKTVYEYTDILVSELPEDIRKKVDNGMKIEGMDKLYGFLENYTS